MGGYAEAGRADPARPPRPLFYFNGGLNRRLRGGAAGAGVRCRA